MNSKKFLKEFRPYGQIYILQKPLAAAPGVDWKGIDGKARRAVREFFVESKQEIPMAWSKRGQMSKVQGMSDWRERTMKGASKRKGDKLNPT